LAAVIDKVVVEEVVIIDADFGELLLELAVVLALGHDALRAG
jgi:hypothetical protein